MCRKLVFLIIVVVLCVANMSYGFARWRNSVGDQDFSKPGNFTDAASLIGGRLIINRGIDYPGNSTLPPIMSYTPDPCYAPISLYTGYDQDDSHVEWYITGGSLHVNGQWDMCRNSGTSSYTEMTGGYLYIDEYISCPMVAGTSATLLLHGGSVRAVEIRFDSGGHIDVAGTGKLIVSGDVRGDVPGWISSGYLTADGGNGTITAEYDGGSDRTVITGSNVTAWEPIPSNNATNICLSPVLRWNEGSLAAATQGHDVYFGTDVNDVTDATTASGLGVYKGRQDTNEYPESGSLSLELGQDYYWRVDEVNGVDVQTGTVWKFTTNDGSAYDPIPENLSTGVDLESNLSWSPGCSAVSHDVYFGTDFNDVNDATTSVHPNVEYLNTGSTSYDPVQDLAFLVTYYWRVDEVGTSETWRGKVWSFRAESAIVDPNLRLWYKFDETEGDTVYDSSGREFNSNDGTVGDNQDPNDGRFGGSLWCDEDIGLAVSPYMLDIRSGITVSVWLKGAFKSGDDNPVFGGGNSSSDEFQLRGAVVDSADEVYWRAGNDSNDVLTWSSGDIDPETLEGWHHWAFVKDETVGDMRIYFDGRIAAANSVGTSTISNLTGKQFKVAAYPWQNAEMIGKIDDFRVYDFGMTSNQVAGLFRGGDVARAWFPTPGDNAKDVTRDIVMTWVPGDFAVQHDVYFGTDWDDVNDATTAVALGVYKSRQNVDSNTYDPLSDLGLNTTYYWRVDEVNDPCVWKGPVWTFTVANFLIIDNFESYNDSDNVIYDTWLEDGSAWLDLGYGGDPAHSGDQSMDFLYFNNVDYGQGYYSEVGRTLGGMDLTAAGVKVLTVFFYGDALNEAGSTEEPYVGLYDGGTYAEVRYMADANYSLSDLTEEEWHEWNMVLSDFTGVSLSNVQDIYVGIGQRGGVVQGGTGEVFFDDVRLYPPKCVPALGPTYDWSGNCVVDIADIGIMGDQWLRTDAVLTSTAPTVGPVAWWELDDGSGTTATDSSVNSNTGALEGSTTWAAGHIGTGAVAFGSDDARIRVPHSAELMPATVSVAAWIYPTQVRSYSARVVAKGIDLGDWEAYYMQFDGSATWTIRDPNHNNHGLSSSDLGLNEWIHVAGTYDGNAVKLYVNGQLEDEDTTGGAAILQDSNDLSIGNRSDGNDRAFIGTIDDVLVYNYALSADEVAYIATQGTGYMPLSSIVNIYDNEAQGQKAVNFRDLAKFMTTWLEEKLWPE